MRDHGAQARRLGLLGEPHERVGRATNGTSMSTRARAVELVAAAGPRGAAPARGQLEAEPQLEPGERRQLGEGCADRLLALARQRQLGQTCGVAKRIAVPCRAASRQSTAPSATVARAVVAGRADVRVAVDEAEAAPRLSPA